jgi:hypothetical protein
MLLDSSDFKDEQQHHRRRLAGVLARLHGCGTVAGLKVEKIAKGDPLPGGKTADEDKLAVQPGVAIDRAGRPLEVPTTRCLRLDRWFNAIAAAGPAVLQPLLTGAERRLVADVFLRYLEVPHSLRPGFPKAGQDATDAIVSSRLTDGFELLLAPRSAENGTPPVPARPYQPAPGTRQELLAAIYNAYQPVSGPGEYPVAPMNDTPAGTPIQKLSERTAVFLARVLIRLEDAPSTTLRRHAAGAFSIEDEHRLVLPAAELLLGLTALA